MNEWHPLPGVLRFVKRVVPTPDHPVGGTFRMILQQGWMRSVDGRIITEWRDVPVEDE
jgi:hypothetical protein